MYRGGAPPSHAPLQPARVRAGVRLGLGLRTAAGWGYQGGAPPCLPPYLPALQPSTKCVKPASSSTTCAPSAAATCSRRARGEGQGHRVRVKVRVRVTCSSIATSEGATPLKHTRGAPGWG